MNKDCEKYFDSIEDLIEGEELNGQTAALIESHVFDCGECLEEYELLRREKEILGHYMFEFEPPADSLANFQARLADDEKTSLETANAPAIPLRPRKRIFALGFSTALAAFTGLLLFFGIGFLLLKNKPFDWNGDGYVAETKSKDSQPSLPQSSETNEKPETDLQTNNDAAKNSEPRVKNQSLKRSRNSLFGRKPVVAETVKIKQKLVLSRERKKPANETVLNDEARAATLRKRNLETEIAGQIEKVELLLRSFRNAQANETVEGFDVEYEKKQARKLLDKNARLRRESENYGISYAEELLSRVEPYLLDIANLGTNPAPDRVLEIKERVVSQNIIASLQMYSPVAMR